MKARLITTIALASLSLAFIFDASPRELTGHDLCTEVVEVLQGAVESEMISQLDAESIAQRCFDNQGGLQ